MPSSQARKERRALDRAASAVAKGLGGEMTPLERDLSTHRRGPNRFMPSPTHHGRTPRRDYICPAKQYAKHPDASVRALAQAQADAYHALNDIMVHGEVCHGKCHAKACRRETRPLPLSMFAKNDHTLRIALGLKRAARIKARGW